MNLKSLAKDTAVYGLSSIVGRFLNYLLVPLYTYRISAGSGGYGIVTNLYAYTALFLALLTFGMETTLFRFSGKEEENPRMVYGTALRMVGCAGLVFLALVFAFLGPISGAMGYAAHPEYVGCMAVIVAMDAFQAIMFSRLRQQGRAIKFAALKFAFIIPNILLNLYVFLLMPRGELFRSMNDGVGLIFFVNLLCTSLVFVGFIPELKGLGYGFDRGLAKRMLRYTWPLLLLSLVGILNQVADKILFPYLIPGEEGFRQLGIYGACVKIAMLLSLLTQAFRYAYEPIVFADKEAGRERTLADGMKWFVACSMIAYVAVVAGMPVLKHFVQPAYWEGLDVVPVVMLAEVFMGVYFNLSFWYKLSDRTWWGAVLSAIGSAVMIGVNIVFVPRFGYSACAWGGLLGYGTAMVLSFLIGRRRYPVHYDFKSILGSCLYGILSVIVLNLLDGWLKMAAGALLVLVFAGLLFLPSRLRGVPSEKQAGPLD